jgi:FKBP-type peptidyl-prolyl cis-trans isomerase
MKLAWPAFILAVAALAATATAQQRGPFKTAQERISYALGVQAGQQFKSRGIDMDTDAFARGLKDAMSGKTPVLNDDQVRSAIEELQAELKRRQIELRRGISADTRKAAEAFLAENTKKDGVVTLASGLQYKIMARGQGRKPTDADTVECNYRGTLIGGLEFDSSARGAGSQTIKVDQAITGLREALKLMPVGSKWQIFVPPALASGSRTATMVIPPDQVLIYDVELLSIK